VFSGNGVVEEFFGGYSDWLRQRSSAPVTSAAGKPPTDTKPKSSVPAAKPKASQRKPSFKEQRELDELPQRIEGLESERDLLHARLADPKSYENKPDSLAEMSARLNTIEAQLAQAYARWEALEAGGG
jgi:ABC transport system ATP-binding/permease protein